MPCESFEDFFGGFFFADPCEVFEDFFGESFEDFFADGVLGDRDALVGEGERCLFAGRGTRGFFA